MTIKLVLDIDLFGKYRRERESFKMNAIKEGFRILGSMVSNVSNMSSTTMPPQYSTTTPS